MKPSRIILVRHGQSEGNINKSIFAHTPDYAVPLTEVGKQQSRQAGQHISEMVGDETIYAYHSPWTRAVQTFEEISPQINSNIFRSIADPRLREQDWGHYKEEDALAKENVNRKEYGKFFFRLQDGESGADVFDRISTFFETLHRDFNKPDYPRNTLIVTHGVTLLIFLMRWFHWPIDEYESYKNPLNGQFVVMELQPDGHYEILTALEKR